MAKTYQRILVLLLSAAMAACSDASNGAGDGDGQDESQAGDDDIMDAEQGNGDFDSEPGDDGSTGIQFPGAGTSGVGDPLQPGIGPETAGQCAATVADATQSEVITLETGCFYSEEEPNVPAASIEQIVEVVEDQQWVHLRLTLNPSFVDNTYGETSLGWEDSKKKEHTFDDLVGSDHAEMLLYDADGNLALHFKVDYISEDAQSPSGYGAFGVSETSCRVRMTTRGSDATPLMKVPNW